MYKNKLYIHQLILSKKKTKVNLTLQILTFLGVNRIVVGVQRAFVADLAGEADGPLLGRALLLSVVLAEVGRVVLDCDVSNLLVNDDLADFGVFNDDVLELFNDC